MQRGLLTWHRAVSKGAAPCRSGRLFLPAFLQLLRASPIRDEEVLRGTTLLVWMLQTARGAVTGIPVPGYYSSPEKLIFFSEDVRRVQSIALRCALPVSHFFHWFADG